MPPSIENWMDFDLKKRYKFHCVQFIKVFNQQNHALHSVIFGYNRLCFNINRWVRSKNTESIWNSGWIDKFYWKKALNFGHLPKCFVLQSGEKKSHLKGLVNHKIVPLSSFVHTWRNGVYCCARLYSMNPNETKLNCSLLLLCVHLWLLA